MCISIIWSFSFLDQYFAKLELLIETQQATIGATNVPKTPKMFPTDPNNGSQLSQPTGPGFLEQEVQNLFSGECFKAFKQQSPDSPNLECMICQPVKKITVRNTQIERHVGGKLHIGQMKNFKLVSPPS